jgi:ribosomal protein S21
MKFGSSSRLLNLMQSKNQVVVNDSFRDKTFYDSLRIRIMPGESIDRALRRLKKAVENSRVLMELRRHEAPETRSQRRRRKSAAARRRGAQT